MPIFISYSHKDKDFVDLFAAQLIQHKVSIWLDRWELHVGDSIIDKIEAAIEGASALLVILSKSSCDSEWCRKELSSGLLRELEERKVVILPVLIGDCKIPLFLRGKLYADFRQNYDEGFKTVLETVAKVTSSTLGRVDSPDFHTDWSLDWGSLEEYETIRLTLVEQAVNQPYCVLTEVVIVADEMGSKEYLDYVSKNKGEYANFKIVTLFKRKISEELDLRITLEDAMPKEYPMNCQDKKTGATYRCLITARRLGQDTGRDVLLNIGDQIALIWRTISDVNKPESNKWENTI